MRLLFQLLLLSNLLVLNATGQDIPYHGAKSMALGSTVTAVPDEWSMFNSIGGIGMIKHSAIVTGLDQLYGIDGLNRAYMGYTQSLSNWAVAGTFSMFGDSFFNESKLSVGIGNQLGIAGLGVRVNYHQVVAEGYDTQIAWSLDFGGIAQLSPTFLIGAEIQNLNQAKYSNSVYSEVPVRFKCGINVIPVTNFHLLAEIEKQIEYPLNLKVGIEYEIVNSFMIRTGINSNPAKMFFGLGFHPDRFMLDYGFGHQSTLGFMHSLGLGYRFIRMNE